MKELIRKSMLLGLGAASLTREKVGKLARELVRRTPANAKDAKWLANQVLRELDKSRKKIEKIGAAEASSLQKRIKQLQNKIVKKSKKTARSILKSASKRIR